MIGFLKLVQMLKRSRHSVLVSVYAISICRYSYTASFFSLPINTSTYNFQVQVTSQLGKHQWETVGGIFHLKISNFQIN